MATRTDGTEVPQHEALQVWADAAYEILKQTAGSYNQLVRYGELQRTVMAQTGIATDARVNRWAGPVLERAARKAAEVAEPSLTSLCVSKEGAVGDGYALAPKAAGSSAAADLEVRAAEDRLQCYRRWATDLPADGGVPTMPPELVLRRRSPGDTTWLAELLAKGFLTVEDHVPFRTHLEVLRLFGQELGTHRSATFAVGPGMELWFPKMYANGDWENTLSSDGQVITMRHVQGGNYGSVMSSGHVRDYVIAFGHVSPAAGPRYYRFLGVFQGDPEQSDTRKWVHHRLADTVAFDGGGDVDFTPRRARRVQDDQVAEAADTDPKTVAAAERQMDEGNYAVEDQISRSSRHRGSFQSAFAKRVKGNYGWECAVTGIRTREFLVASHIVPWGADKTIRLDPTNGICLSTMVDKAFDGGYLTITPEGRTAVRWERVGDDAMLKAEMTRIDDVQLRVPERELPDPAKLARRAELI